MEQFIDHDNIMTDQDVTTAWERFLSLLVAFGQAVIAFFKAPWQRGDYMPRLYTPTNPAYFTARKRDPATIITNLLTDEKRAAQASGAAHLTTSGDVNCDAKAMALSQIRDTETVSVRSFVESRCPTMKQGKHFWF